MRETETIMGKSPHFIEQPKEPQAREDLRDTRNGVHDDGVASPDGEDNLPEGLRRPRKAPVDRDTGRNKDNVK